MKIKTPKDQDFEKIYKAYAGLIEWIGGNDRLAKDEVLEVVGVTYAIESMMRPTPTEVH